MSVCMWAATKLSSLKKHNVANNIRADELSLRPFIDLHLGLIECIDHNCPPFRLFRPLCAEIESAFL
jgi:hypothetical protein